MSFSAQYPAAPFSAQEHPMLPVVASSADDWVTQLWRAPTDPRSDPLFVQGTFDLDRRCMVSTSEQLQAVIAERPLLDAATISYICVEGEGAPYVDVAVYPPTATGETAYLGWNGTAFVAGPAVATRSDGTDRYWYRLGVRWDGAYGPSAISTVFYAKTYRYKKDGAHPPFRLWAFTYDPELAGPVELATGATRADLLSDLRRPLIRRSTNPTPAPGTTITVGAIVVDFADVRAADPDPASHWAALDPAQASAWLLAESGGRFVHEFELHDQIVGLPHAYADYRDDTVKLTDDVDTLLDIPDHWEMVIICSANEPELSTLFTSQRITCTFDETVTGTTTSGGETLPTVLIDQSVYGERNERAWAVLVHEMLHGLGLTDLYGGKPVPSRSFGWSMMADARTAWHLLAWEKLLLGWLSPDDVAFVTSGVAEVNLVPAGQPGTKAAVVLEDSRAGAHFFEWSQETGGDSGARVHPYRELHRSADGLLAYRVDLVGHRPPVTLYPYRTGDREAGYGGAPRAPYPAHPRSSITCGRNEVIADLLSFRERGDRSLTLRVGKRPGHVAPAHRFVPDLGENPAMALRIDEHLVSTDRRWSVRFQDDGSVYAYRGDVSAPGAGRPAARWGPAVDAVSAGEKFELYLGVNRFAELSSNFGTGPDDHREVLMSVAPDPKAGPTSLSQGFLSIDAPASGLPSLVFSSGHGPDDPSTKILTRVPWTEVLELTLPVQQMTTGQYLESEDGAYTLTLQADNYLTVRDRNGDFVWHLAHTGPKVSIDGQGHVVVADDRGTKTWTFDGTFAAPVDAASPQAFSFRLTNAGHVEVVQGSGATAKVLYQLTS